MDDMILWEHKIGFEDYKKTVMHHGILVEDDYRFAKMIEEADQDMQAYFADRLID